MLRAEFLLHLSYFLGVDGQVLVQLLIAVLPVAVGTCSLRLYLSFESLDFVAVSLLDGHQLQLIGVPGLKRTHQSGQLAFEFCTPSLHPNHGMLELIVFLYLIHQASCQMVDRAILEILSQVVILQFSRGGIQWYNPAVNGHGAIQTLSWPSQLHPM